MAIFNLFGKKDKVSVPSQNDEPAKKMIKITKKVVSSNPILSDAAVSVVDKSILLREQEEQLIKQKIKADSREAALIEKEIELENLKIELLDKINEPIISKTSDTDIKDLELFEQKNAIEEKSKAIEDQINILKIEQEKFEVDAKNFVIEKEKFANEKFEYERLKQIDQQNNSNEIIDLNQKIKDLKKNEIELLKKLEDLEKINDQKEQQIVQFQSTNKTLQNEIEKYVKEVEAIANIESNLKSKYEEKQINLDELNESLKKELFEAVELKISLEEELEMLKNKFEGQISQNIAANEYQFKIDELNTIISKLKIDLKDSNAILQNQENEINSLNNEKNKLLAEIENREELAIHFQRNLQSVELELDKKEKTIQNLQKQSLKKNSDQEKSENKFKDFELQLEEKNTQIKQLIEKLNQFEQSQRTLQDAQIDTLKLNENLQNKLADLLNENKSYKQKAIDLEKNIAVLNIELSNSTQFEKEYHKLSSELNILKDSFKKINEEKTKLELTSNDSIKELEKRADEIKNLRNSNNSYQLQIEEKELNIRALSTELKLAKNTLSQTNITDEDKNQGKIVESSKILSLNIQLENGDSFEAELENNYTGQDIIDSLIDSEILTHEKTYEILWVEKKAVIALDIAIEILGLKTGDTIKLNTIK